MENKRYLHAIRECLNLIPEEEDFILDELKKFQLEKLREVCDRFGYSMDRLEGGFKERKNIIKEDLERRKIERGIVPLGGGERDKERFFGNLTILYDSLRIENPDRVVGILRGGAGYTSLAELFGYDVDYIEAHHERSPNYTAENFENSTIQDLNPESRVLLIEEGISLNNRKRTYEIVKDYLIKRYNISKNNFPLFIGGLPDINLKNLPEYNRILRNQNTYSNHTLIDWGRGGYSEDYVNMIANEAEIPLPIIYSEDEACLKMEEMIEKLKDKLK